MSVLIRSLIVTFGLSLLLGCGSSDNSITPETDGTVKDDPQQSVAGSSDHAETKGPMAELPDEERILGSWHTIFFEEDGKADSSVDGGKVVFLKDRMFLHGLPSSYTLDSTQSPRHLNSDLPAIYEINGDSLILCTVQSSTSPRPTDFTTSPGDGRVLIKCERLQPLDPQSADADYDSNLKEVISTAIQQLEAEQFEEFVKAHLPPDQTATIGEMELAQRVQHVADFKDTLVNTMRALQKIKPEMNASQTEATFDLSHVHIEGVFPLPHAKFIKQDGRWYIQQ